MKSKCLIPAAILLLMSAQAFSQVDIPSWNRDIERLDEAEDPPEKGDNNFFTAVTSASTTTNVTMLYAAHQSMGAFPQKLYHIRADLGGGTATGCTNTYFNNLSYFMPTGIAQPSPTSATPVIFNPSFAYVDPGPTWSGGGGQSDGLVDGNAYRYLNWPVNGSGGATESVAAACANATSTGVASNACKVCVNSKGYWLNPAVTDSNQTTSAGVFSTRFLRFYPPKWTLLSLAYKRLINGPLLSSLREAVVGYNFITDGGGYGGSLYQGMLPNSCNGQGRPHNQKVAAIDSMPYTSSAAPLAESMSNIMYTMSGCPGTCTWPIGDARSNSVMGFSKPGPCNSCSGDFIVLLSDGRGDSANPACTGYSDGGIPPYCALAAQCSTVGMGAEGDGDDFLDPSYANVITGSGVRQTPGGTCDMDFADDVARYMATNGVAFTGIPAEQDYIKTFVVGIGDPANTYNEMTSLQAVASAGQGLYLVADNFGNLEANIETTFTTIINRATSFSAAAITTVQTHGYTSAFIPRFVPSAGAQWQGTMSRYQLFNEFASGCTAADYGLIDANNPNGNSSCFDIYLTDANGKFIGENMSGVFMIQDNTQPYDGGWPTLGVTADGGGGTPATPFWEAASLLATRETLYIAGNPTQIRKIYTVAPSGTTGTYAAAMVNFTVANVSNITPLLKLGGLYGDTCTTLGFRTRHAYVTEDDCAKDVIKFVQGEDVLLQNPANRVAPVASPPLPRPKILGDIFHSTPVLVTPPVATYLCDLGVANQCVPSLYNDALETGSSTAYATYFSTYNARTQMVIVGSNDGMLHAFNAGNSAGSDAGVAVFDLGTGQESWAFIPPDMLPKLARYILGSQHELFVDGTPMVRDIWVDGSGASLADGQKQADEFHTVAIVGEREGGRQFNALDVTDTNNPKFLWAWPPPGTTESLQKGESWSDLGPAPAPIGPIAEYSASGIFQVNGTNAKERYIFATGGGHDPAMLRGRGIYMLDAWTGGELYRFARSDSLSADTTDPRYHLFPVFAPVSLIDVNSDGVFDTAVVGDSGGQVWTVSMVAPGVLNVVTGRYTNWSAGRSFIQFNTLPFWHRSPFSQRAVAGIDTSGNVRVLIGSGDRDQIKDPDGGTCGLPDMGACFRKGCSVTVSSTNYRVGVAPSGAGLGHYFDQVLTYTGGAQAEPSNTFISDVLVPSNLSSDVADAQMSYTLNCGSAQTFNANVYCDWGAGVDGGSDCPVNSGRPFNATADAAPLVTMEDSRFYSFLLYDAANRAQFGIDGGGGTFYDSHALTDTDLTSSDGGATSNANGWYVTHANSGDEKSSSSGLLLDGCVIWNTLVPSSITSVTCGSTLPLDTAYTYQADALTGAVSCGSAGSSTYTAISRYTSRSTYVAPQQPALVVSVNATTGQVAYGGVSIEPGSAPLSVTMGVSGLQGTIHWLEVPRKLHECRHSGINCQ